MDPITTLREKLAKLTADAKAIQNAADAETRSLTVEENQKLDSITASFDEIDAEIGRRERIAQFEQKLSAPQARKVQPETPRSPITGGDIVAAKGGNWGFATPSQYFKAVINAKSGSVDPRLAQNAVATYASEGVNADGGYALPPDFRAGIVSILSGPESLLARLDPVFTASNAVTLPVDEDTPWSAAGIQPGAVAEGAAYGQHKPVLKPLNISLQKYGDIVSVTEEMLEDGTQIAPFVQNKASDKLLWKLNAAIFSALTGSGSKKASSKGTTGVGLPPTIANIQTMWTDLYTKFRGTAVWLANPLLETTFQNYTIGSGAWPAYLPPGGLSQAPFATLYGKPIIFTELCSAVGTEGDIVLADLHSLYGVQKSQGIRSEVTPYFAWDQDLMSFKVSVRVGIKSKLSAVITKPDTTTASNIVTLTTR